MPNPLVPLPDAEAWTNCAVTTLPGSGTDHGRRATALNSVKRLVFRPIPSTRAVQAAIVKPVWARRLGPLGRGTKAWTNEHEQAAEPEKCGGAQEKAQLALLPRFEREHHALSLDVCSTLSRNTSRKPTGDTSTETADARRACSTTAAALRLTSMSSCRPLARTCSTPGTLNAPTGGSVSKPSVMRRYS